MCPGILYSKGQNSSSCFPLSSNCDHAGYSGNHIDYFRNKQNEIQLGYFQHTTLPYHLVLLILTLTGCMLPLIFCFHPSIQQLLSRSLNHAYFCSSVPDQWPVCKDLIRPELLHILPMLPRAHSSCLSKHDTKPCSDNLLSKSSYAFLPRGWQMTHKGELCLPEYGGVN